ncbi:hypothetical protein [Aquimarina brevivitae]|uniref:Uncharacterized protein n=1 Tax=Aquimarina brevivitae TaxID=323412 RepID=A0A4Q7NTW1_9FLAO|nr:hypothetical protein [Aquimarina brevivitae]RZS90567.1 hypothetical protein EV197_3361 [Aquimarina brevivitae]
MNKSEKEIQSDIKRLRKVLFVFTILHLMYVAFLLVSLDTILMNVVCLIAFISFYVYYVLFIWSMPLDKFDKWKESILACIFGLFAMWLWVQFNTLEDKR